MHELDKRLNLIEQSCPRVVGRVKLNTFMEPTSC